MTTPIKKPTPKSQKYFSAKLRQQKHRTQSAHTKKEKILSLRNTKKEKTLPRKKFIDQQTLKKSLLNPIAARKIFSLSLPFGPYRHSFSRNGRHLLLTGEKGHVAVVDWQSLSLCTEFTSEVKNRHGIFLFDSTMIAVAHKKCVGIYDGSGIEVHILRTHNSPRRLNFLPYHFLLASIGRSGHLRYTDISTGEKVSDIATKMGPCRVLESNPWNGVMHCGHLNGIVSLWSPTQKEPLAKVKCYKGPVLSAQIDLQGKFMVTADAESTLKVWDLRKFGCVESARVQPCQGANFLALSPRNFLAMGRRNEVVAWPDVFRKGFKEKIVASSKPGRRISEISFCPFEDVLGISSADGYSSAIVPGSGEQCFDSMEVNPFESKKERGNRLVRGLVEKIQPEMIALDPEFIGNVRGGPIPLQTFSDKKRKEISAVEQEVEEEANNGALFKKANFSGRYFA